MKPRGWFLKMPGTGLFFYKCSGLFAGKTVPSKTEIIVDDLLYRLRKEAAIAEGARNMIRYE